MRDRELTIMQHLGELRRRVIICVLALIAGSAVGVAVFRQIIELLLQPARDLEAGTNGQLIFIEVTELGRFFVRNVAMVFDAYLGLAAGGPGRAGARGLAGGLSPLFSRTV